MNSSFWPGLESIRGLRAVSSVWQRGLGESLGAFQSAFLQRTGAAARHFPCPRGCGCAHEVIHHADGSIVGVCRCDSWNCDDLPLTVTDIELWELSWPRLGAALCRALGLDRKTAEFGLHHTRQIGSWSADAVPVVLTIQDEASFFGHAVGTLSARLRQPFILLAPTAAHLDAIGKELLANAGAGFFPLESHVFFNSAGTLRSRSAPGELFARFAPRAPVPEDTALRAFALIQALDSAPGVRKGAVFSVFRLYCVEGLSADQVAKRCRCSKGTVINRLRMIRKKTGTAPEQLRAYSAQFSRIEASLTDSRARRIHRPSAIDDAAATETDA